MRSVLTGLAAAGTLLVFGVTTAHADTDDFHYESWHVDYQIDVDDSGRAIAEVTETLVPVFPQHDQNRGIVRGLPIDYEGTSTDPRDFSVTDEAGNPVPFETEREGGFAVVLVGDDNYVHGRQTYVIEYTLSDIILARDDDSADEFYWDLVDFEHAQPIDQFSGSITFSPELASQLNGNMECYTGASRSSGNCDLTQGGSGGTIDIAPIDLQPYHGVTVAIGLEAGSVTQPATRLPSFSFDIMPLILGGAALVTSGIAVAVAGRMVVRRRSTRDMLIPRFEVPRDLPPLLAAPIVGVHSHPVATAQIIHLAVNGAIRIEEEPGKKGMFGTQAKPNIVFRLMDRSQAQDQLDAQALDELFSPSDEPGTTFALPKRDHKFARSLHQLSSHGMAASDLRGYFERVHSPRARTLGYTTLAIGVVTLVLAVIGVFTRQAYLPAIGGAAGVVAILLALAAMRKHRVHTELGAQTRQYLLGVKDFIQRVEADRFELLQSYSGAMRQKDGDSAIIRLYERLLPYAILFRLENEWVKVLETRYNEYTTYTPLWYPGLYSAGMGNISSTISQFTSSLNSSVSYSSSSSGGSTGGGYAGGGGGGGFSGGR